MDPTITAILIILVTILLVVVTAMIAAHFREDVRLTLYSRFLNPLYIIAGKDHMVREGMERDVYNLIRQYPGISYGRLLQDLDVDDATLSFQLSRLLREKLVSQLNENGILSFTPNYITRENPGSQGMPPMSPLEHHILDSLRNLGPAARVEIETTLKIPPSTVNKALDSLKRRGLVGFDGEDKWSYCWAVGTEPRLK